MIVKMENNSTLLLKSERENVPVIRFHVNGSESGFTFDKSGLMATEDMMELSRMLYIAGSVLMLAINQPELTAQWVSEVERLMADLLVKYDRILQAQVSMSGVN